MILHGVDLGPCFQPAQDLARQLDQGHTLGGHQQLVVDGFEPLQSLPGSFRNVLDLVEAVDGLDERQAWCIVAVLVGPVRLDPSCQWCQVSKPQPVPAADQDAGECRRVHRIMQDAEPGMDLCHLRHVEQPAE